MRDDEFSEGEFDVDLDPVGTEPADEYLAIEA